MRRYSAILRIRCRSKITFFGWALVGVVAVITASTGGGVLASNGQAQIQTPTLEHQVKASLLYNFLSFIEWPEDAYADHPETFRLCVIAEQSFEPALKLVEGEIVHGKHLHLDMFSTIELSAFETCNALYLGHAMASSLDAVLAHVEQLPVLTVSDTPGFVDLGGVIGFTRVENKIRFKINVSSAKRSRLVISSHLLRLAEQVVQ